MMWDRETERKAGKVYHLGSSLFGILFAVVWCIIAASMGAWVMLLFGIPFVGLMVFHTVMGVKHMNAEKRRHTTAEREPWEQQEAPQRPAGEAKNGFCPYCGSSLEESFAFCPHCGRKRN